MAANDDPGIEIRRQNKTTPTVVAVVIAAIVAVVVVRDPGGSFDDDPVTTTIPISEQTTTTEAGDPLASPSTAAAPPRRNGPDALGLGIRGEGPFTFRWRQAAFSMREVTNLELPDGARAVATDDLLAVVGLDGTLLVAGTGHSFRAAACCFEHVSASNEPRHVWAHDDQAAVLIDLDTDRTITTVALEGRRVLGPGPFGLVVIDEEEHAIWLRPGFDPSPVQVPENRIPIDAGGTNILYLVSGTFDVEVRRVSDGALVRSLSTPGQGPTTATISSSGDAAALRRDGTTVVYSILSGTEVGRFATDEPSVVSIGSQRFAGVVGDEVVDSTGRRFSVVADQLVIATRAE